MAPLAKTILIVDDEPFVLTVAVRILQSAGYEVLSAADGRIALALCGDAEHPIDLLLTDIKMPRMNGVELARCVADQKPGVPIMFMTGHASDSDVKQLLLSQPDMDGHALLAKPFTPKQLTSAVDRLLKQADEDHVRKAD